MTRNEIINKVQIYLNEMSPFDSGDIVNNSLIDNILDECADQVQMQAPTYMCKPLDMGVTEGTPYTDDETGYVVLPSDYLRLSRFRMSEWKRAVVNAYSPMHPVYGLQRSKYTRGGIAKPVVIILAGSTDRRLEYYSVESSHSIDEAWYVPERVAEDLPDTLIEPLIYVTASQALLILKMGENSKIMQDKFNNWLQTYMR